MGASIDLRKAHLSRQYGDLTAILTWFNDQRALILVPTFRRAGVSWFIVQEPVAHEWNDQDKDNFKPSLTAAQRKRILQLPPPVREVFLAELAHSGLLHRAGIACTVLGIEPSQANVHRIIGIVNDAIPDLIEMPSAPPQAYRPGSFGALKVLADGKLIGGDDIRVPDEGARYG